MWCTYGKKKVYTHRKNKTFQGKKNKHGHKVTFAKIKRTEFSNFIIYIEEFILLIRRGGSNGGGGVRGCMHVCMRACMYACVHVCRVYAHACMCAVCVRMHAWGGVCMRACTGCVEEELFPVWVCVEARN